MRRLVATVMSAVLLSSLMLAASVLPVSAGTQGGCAAGDSTKVRLYENAIGDTADGDDQLYICGSSAVLANIDHTLPGTCNVGLGGVIGMSKWSNCTNSIAVYLPSGYWVCVWRNSNFTELIFQKGGPVTGTRYNFPSYYYDTADSVTIQNHSCTIA